MYKNILVSLDLFREEGNAKIIEVVRKQFSGEDVNIHLFTVQPYDEGLGVLSQFIPEGFVKSLAKDSMRKLEEIAADLKPDFAKCDCSIKSGNAYVEVLAFAESVSADLIVIGSSRPELKAYLLGPNASRIVRHATSSTFIVR